MKAAALSPRAARRTAAALALAALAALSGCAVTVHEQWDAAPKHPPLPAVNVVVAATDLAGVCGNYPGMKLYGCAKRDYARRVCVIYTAAQPAQWLLEHERKHCDGWDHAAPAAQPAMTLTAVGN